MVESTEHDSKKHDYWSKDKYFLQVTLRSTLKYLIAPPFSITPTVDRTQLQGRSTNPYIFTLHNLDAVHEKFIKILMLVHKISKNILAIICVLRYGCQIVKTSFRNFLTPVVAGKEFSIIPTQIGLRISTSFDFRNFVVENIFYLLIGS